MTAVSTRIPNTNFYRYEGPARLYLDNYPEAALRSREHVDVRSFGEVMTHNYGPEGSGWDYVKEHMCAHIGSLVIYPDGDAYALQQREARRTPHSGV